MMKYNRPLIETLIAFISENGGETTKKDLEQLVKLKFNLTKDRSVFYCSDFSIRFSQAKSLSKFANCVLSLSSLQKFDDKPFFVCVVTKTENILLLANASFLSKISHSSHKLSIDNIRGTFLGTDILKQFGNISNTPSNFEELFLLHSEISFTDNLERLVETTNNIVGRNLRFVVDCASKNNLKQSPHRAKEFSCSEKYSELDDDLKRRVEAVKNEIVIASLIDNVNLRGRVIEYLITHGESDGIRREIISALKNNNPLPHLTTKNDLGNYSSVLGIYDTKTDIKTKVLYLGSAPKAYNIDKLLEFLANSNAVYMFFFVGIGEEENIKTRLCSVFDKKLLSGTIVQFHWAGRCSRGVSQFRGTVIDDILNTYDPEIDIAVATKWVDDLINL